MGDIHLSMDGEFMERFVEPLRKMDEMTASLAQSKVLIPEGDALMRQLWIEHLRSSLAADMEVFWTLIGDQRFGNEPLVLSPAEAESVLRAAASLRMRIREAFLSDVDDGVLEKGMLDVQSLPPDLQKVYVSYIFLGSLQELLISHL
ncbi:MAG TPA: hypothetical protein PKX94_08120 [Opitutales bacterium]|nr:hypothetical protein [Opitutales bacterium]